MSSLKSCLWSKLFLSLLVFWSINWLYDDNDDSGSYNVYHLLIIQYEPATNFDVFLLFHLIFKYFFYFFLFVWYYYHMYVIPLSIVPQFLDILFWFFHSFCFSLHFSLQVSTEKSSSSLMLSLAMSNLLVSSSKALFISVTMFFISSISFGFFLRISYSLLILPFVLACCPLFIRVLSILIIVILNLVW